MRMRMDENKRNTFIERLMALESMLYDYEKEDQARIKGEITYIKGILRADEFSSCCEYPVF